MEKESFGSTRQLKIGLCLFVAAVLQVSLVQFVSTGLRYIDWLLLVVVYLGLQQRNHTVVLVAATVAGILKDASSGAGVIAVSGIAYLFAAYVADRIASVIVLDNLAIRFGTVAAASFINTVLQLVIYQILGFELTNFVQQEGILAVIVLSLIANLFASVLVFFFNGSHLQGSVRRRLAPHTGDARFAPQVSSLTVEQPVQVALVRQSRLFF